MCKSSSELQYIIELGGQRLLPVVDTNLYNYTPISKRLQLLRDKTRAWFKFDINSVETVSIPDQFYDGRLSLADGHLCLYNRDEDSAKIFPILPKPSQQTIERGFSPRSLCLVPNTDIIDVFMDPAQNLIAIAYVITEGVCQPGGVRFFIELNALDGGGVHPQAAGRTLFMSGPPQCENIRFEINSGKLKGFGRRIALWCSLRFNGAGSYTFNRTMWWLQIWDWQHSTTSISVLSDTFNSVPDDSMDFCFLGDDRLLIASYSLKVYSIEDMSQAPQFLACFLLPVPPMMKIRCILPMDDIAHSSQSQMQAQQTMWTLDPQHRLISLLTFYPHLIFIISTRIFFDLDVFEGMVAAIPWKYWGPLNARVFYDQHPWILGVSGNRVLFRAADSVTGCRLHMMDFNPLAVKCRQGLGRVVKESSTIKISEWGEDVTSSLPYVEIVLDRRFGSCTLDDIWVDKDRIYLLKMTQEVNGTDQLELEVIDI
ncbi:hypothetical protein DEU56DRAFT_906368 [Suillus clintonianus]|uniref:uncharacterized protein n=1 Tax=Suillus clintonianus TaxID=1904413 RepID=UPI001B868F20|nr:uncharacterized protein DEU56DRAFT_906368 [Suillus clintonianus]KAG2156197.1 hypothetical protein DEU56DRAFT_906368 [Suillus clintonianus]